MNVEWASYHWLGIFEVNHQKLSRKGKSSLMNESSDLDKKIAPKVVPLCVPMNVFHELLVPLDRSQMKRVHI